MAYKYGWWAGVQLGLVLLLLVGACSRDKQKSPENQGTAGTGSHAPASSGAHDGGAGPDAPDEAAGGVLEPRGAGGAHDGGAAGGDAEFVDPVAASQADKSTLGVDADGNGVRDDLADYLKSLFQDPSEQALLTSLAREETRLLLLGEDPQSSPSQVREQALRSMAVHHCVVDGLGAERARIALTELQSALVNNQRRFGAWLAAERKLNGSILPSMACDSGLVQP